jgi:hypothetical protein
MAMFQLFDHSAGLSAGDRVRLRRVEQKLDLILEHLGLTFVESSNLPPEARALADAGEKIAAIKALREATGLGLVAAKLEVEEYMAGKA